MRVFSYLIAFCFLTFSKSYSLDFVNIDEGVYVHFGKQEDSNKFNLGDIANIGFIIGSDSIAVIDTGSSVKIGKKMFNKIREISQIPISHIIITHSHPDHFFWDRSFHEK